MWCLRDLGSEAAWMLLAMWNGARSRSYVLMKQVTSRLCWLCFDLDLRPLIERAAIHEPARTSRRRVPTQRPTKWRDHSLGVPGPAPNARRDKLLLVLLVLLGLTPFTLFYHMSASATLSYMTASHLASASLFFWTPPSRKVEPQCSAECRGHTAISHNLQPPPSRPHTHRQRIPHAQRRMRALGYRIEQQNRQRDRRDPRRLAKPGDGELGGGRLDFVKARVFAGFQNALVWSAIYIWAR